MFQQYIAVFATTLMGFVGVGAYQYMVQENNATLSSDEPISIKFAATFNNIINKDSLVGSGKSPTSESGQNEFASAPATNNIEQQKTELLDLRNSYRSKLIDIIQHIKSLGKEGYIRISENNKNDEDWFGSKIVTEIESYQFIIRHIENTFDVRDVPGIAVDVLNDNYHLYVAATYDLDVPHVVGGKTFHGFQIHWSHSSTDNNFHESWAFIDKKKELTIKKMGTELKEITDKLTLAAKKYNVESQTLCQKSHSSSSDVKQCQNEKNKFIKGITI